MKILTASMFLKTKQILIDVTSKYNHFSSHHIPTSQSYPNIKCIISSIDADSHNKYCM